MWTLVAAFLVFGMQVGFTMLEAGFCRSRETVNVLMECIVDTCLCGLLFYAFGFAFMFSHGNGFIGYHWFFLQGRAGNLRSHRRGVPGLLALPVRLCRYLLDHHFGRHDRPHRVRRRPALQLRVSGFIYPIIGHWAWGPDGFLALMGSDGHFLPSLGMGFHDFAGSTVVHTIGGFIALAGAIVLGPRLGPQVQARRRRPHAAARLDHRRHRRTAPVVRLVRIQSRQHALRHGLRGHRPRRRQHHAGGLRGRSDGHVLRLTSMSKKWDVSFTVNGFLAGLVAITCPCYWVSPTGAILLGGIAGVIVVLGVELLEWLRIDDPIGAVPVHGICGIWGTLSLGLFACGKYGATGPARSRQLGAAERTVLRRRTAGAEGPGHRQRDHHRRDLRGCAWW